MPSRKTSQYASVKILISTVYVLVSWHLKGVHSMENGGHFVTELATMKYARKMPDLTRWHAYILSAFGGNLYRALHTHTHV